MATDEEIKREFNRSGFGLVEEDEILKRCKPLISLCRISCPSPDYTKF